MNYFSALIKPASSLCNMRCRYCFYADVADNREVPSYGVMDRTTMECLIDRVMNEIQPPAQVTFAFQGGEPTVAGLEFFQQFTDYAERRNAGRCRLRYAIQTNGLVLNEGWCALFQRYGFLVGISLDGEESLHNFGRPDAKGQGTYSRVRQSIRLLEEHGVEYNILSVITKQAAKHPQKAFQFYRRNHFDFVQLIPCLRPLDAAEDGPCDLTPRLYADFYKRFFQLWFEALQKGEYLSVRQFDNILMLLQGQPAEQCGMMGRCSPQFVVEADGGVYPCDFYVLDGYRCGNVKENTLQELSRSQGIQAFLQHREPEHPLCATCRVRSLCRGGCRRYRSFYASEPGYCPHQDFLYATVDRFAAAARMV
ncbi:MAG: SPASM domain-containing protein [Clostridiales bacterium]|jgi:uncharacterized protein|nr:SPASM domain-containing protein [Clostridiales bacterium]